MPRQSFAGQRFSLRHQLLCSALVCATLLPSPSVEARNWSSNPYTSTLQDYLAKEPQRFNERMWDLIRANPEAREQIMSEAIRLSLAHEIALKPNDKEQILAKFKKLYPQYSDRLEDYALSEQPEATEFSSFKDTSKVRVFADDPETAPTGARTSWFGRNWPWVLLAGGGGGGAAVAIAASGGSSNSTSSTPAPPVYTNPPAVGEQQEYNNQSGLSRIDAADANLAGATGAGIIVAVIDSGVNIQHPDLKNQIVPGGYDFIHNTSTVTDLNEAFHGTHVAGIIAAEKNDFGIRGVAYGAKILPIAAIDPAANGTEIVSAVNLAKTKGARVINASYGPSDITGYVNAGAQYFFDQDLAEANKYLEFVNSNNGVVVFAAGNEYDFSTSLISNHPTGGGFLPFIRPANKNIALGQPGAYRYVDNQGHLQILNADYSALEGHLIAAVALNTDNTTIASFSNHCGVAKDWCIAAPGVNITSTSATNTYDALSGTSFAAPHVSGAIAALLQAYPTLTVPQAINLLFNTATDLGDPGVDDIYGHGALNLGAAQLAQGPLMVVTGSSMYGSQYLLNNSSVRSSPAFGASFTNALSNTKIGYLDSYQRNFSTALTQRVTSRLSTLDGLNAVQRFGQDEFRPSIAIDDKSHVSFTLRPKDGVQRVADQDSQGSLLNSYSFTQKLGSDVAMSVSHNDARANALSFNDADRSLLSSQVTGNGVGNPYLDFVADGYANNVTMDLPWEGRFRATAAMGAAAEDSGQHNMLAMAEVGFGNQTRAVTLTTGAMIEQDRLLGLQGTGAFGMGQGTTTWFSGISGRWQVAPKTEVMASFYGGVTNAKTTNDSLVRGIDSVTSTTWRVGLAQSDVAQDGDRFRVNVTQPLRAESGGMNLSLPQYRLQDGTIVRSDARYGLAPSGREIDFEAGYSFAVDDASKVDFAAMYRRDAGHVAGKDEAIGVTRFSRGF